VSPAVSLVEAGRKPDLVCWIRLPDIDGVEFIRDLRSWSERRSSSFRTLDRGRQGRRSTPAPTII
jgi:CheY-like chemotaxis protein